MYQESNSKYQQPRKHGQASHRTDMSHGPEWDQRDPPGSGTWGRRSQAARRLGWQTVTTPYGLFQDLSLLDGHMHQLKNSLVYT